MIDKLKNKWKYSKFRFYYKNLIWNTQFYLLSKKKFKDIIYIKGEEVWKPEIVNKKRFIGYEFKGNTYLDNPGFLDVEEEVLKHWKRNNYF